MKPPPHSDILGGVARKESMLPRPFDHLAMAVDAHTRSVAAVAPLQGSGADVAAPLRNENVQPPSPPQTVKRRRGKH